MTVVFLTDLGDSLLLAMLTLSACAFFLQQGCRSAALALFMAVSVTAIFIAALKLAFLSCSHHAANFRIESPSGHAAMAAAVYGMLGLLMARRLSSSVRLIPLCVAAFIATGIAVTRVTMGFHTAPEIALGLLSGALGIGAGWLVLRRRPAARFNMGWLLAIIVFIAVCFHGTRLPAEPFLRLLAFDLRQREVLCRNTVGNN